MSRIIQNKSGQMPSTASGTSVADPAPLLADGHSPLMEPADWSTREIPLEDQDDMQIFRWVIPYEINESCNGKL